MIRDKPLCGIFAGWPQPGPASREKEGADRQLRARTRLAAKNVFRPVRTPYAPAIKGGIMKTPLLIFIPSCSKIIKRSRSRSISQAEPGPSPFVAARKHVHSRGDDPLPLFLPRRLAYADDRRPKEKPLEQADEPVARELGIVQVKTPVLDQGRVGGVSAAQAGRFKPRPHWPRLRLSIQRYDIINKYFPHSRRIRLDFPAQ